MTGSPIEEMRTPEALRFQRRAVAAERVGWGLMALLVVAALAGVFGPGPLSTSRAGDDGRLEVEYSRFLRVGSTTTVDVLLTVEDPSLEPRVRFGTDYLSTFTIEGVQPEPDHVVAHGDHLEFVFAPPQDASDITLSFALRADRFGPRSGPIEAAGGTAWISQFIYP